MKLGTCDDMLVSSFVHGLGKAGCMAKAWMGVALTTVDRRDVGIAFPTAAARCPAKAVNS